MHRRFVILALAILTSACAPAATDPTTRSTTTLAPASATSQPVAAPTTTAPATLPPPCLAGDIAFSSGGLIAAFGSGDGDAAQVSGIRTARHAGCERVVVDLLTVDGAPAGSLGAVGVEYDEVTGIIRIKLPAAVTETAIADSLFDGDLADRAYVVRTLQGRLAVDIHVVAGRSAGIRAFEVARPSRIVVDIRPAPEAMAVAGATIADNVVVTHPRTGATTTPLVVSGYARTFEAQVVASLHDSRESAAVAEGSTIATDWTEAWGEFTLTLPTAPARPLELFVGADSPQDGTPQGVWISLDLSSTDPVDPADT